MSVLDRMSLIDWIVVASVWLFPAALWLFKTWIDRGPRILPSAEDLDAYADEQRIREETNRE